MCAAKWRYNVNSGFCHRSASNVLPGLRLTEPSPPHAKPACLGGSAKGRDARLLPKLLLSLLLFYLTLRRVKTTVSGKFGVCWDVVATRSRPAVRVFSELSLD